MFFSAAVAFYFREFVNIYPEAFKITYTFLNLPKLKRAAMIFQPKKYG
jgi:hypothetical protein